MKKMFVFKKFKKAKNSRFEFFSKTGQKNRKMTENRKLKEKPELIRENRLKPKKIEENLEKEHTAAANGPAHPVHRFRRERIAPAMSGE
jgi:hypothetical protein